MHPYRFELVFYDVIVPLPPRHENTAADIDVFVHEHPDLLFPKIGTVNLQPNLRFSAPRASRKVISDGKIPDYLGIAGLQRSRIIG